MNAIDFSLLPPPNVLETLNYQQILTRLLNEYRSKDQQYISVSEADPVYKLLETVAYQELLQQQRVNDACKALTLTYATGADLDHLAHTYYRNNQGQYLSRFEQETDEHYRQRLQQSYEGLSVAGPDGAYVYHALNASKEIKDVAVFGPHSTVHTTEPGCVDLYLLTKISQAIPFNVTQYEQHQHNGSATQSLINHVSDYLWPKRPLTDLVKVKSVKIKPYHINVRLMIKNGLDKALILAAARENLVQYLMQQHHIGAHITQSNIHWALTISGVEKVELTQWQDIICNAIEAPFCCYLIVTQA